MARSSTSGSIISSNAQHSIKLHSEAPLSDGASDTSHETAEHALFTHDHGGSNCGRKRWIFVGILVLMLAGIATALGVTLRKEEQNSVGVEQSSNLRGSGASDVEDTFANDNSEVSDGENASTEQEQGDNFRDIPERPEQPDKKSWPELKGMDVDEAKTIIQQERPDLNVIVVQVGDYVTFDYDTQRVWLWVNKDGLVDQMPKVG